MRLQQIILTVGFILIASIAFNTYQGFDNHHSISRVVTAVSNNAQTSCEVQSTGLSAQPYLTSAMREIGILLAPKPGEKPRPGQQTQFLVVEELRANLESYVKIESKQPLSRDCSLP